MRKKIFLTGGTGFFGKSILSMIQRGFASQYEFLILSRNPEKFLADHPQFTKLKQIRFLMGDVTDFVFPEEHFNWIFHAATPTIETLPPGEMQKIILNGTRHVLDFAKQCDAEKFLFVSSGAVYGPQPPEVINLPEELPCHPVTEYGIAKLDAEKMCQDSGIYTCIARCFAFAGHYLKLDAHFAIGNFLENCLSGKDILIKGDGTPFRSYLDADDLVEWLFAILERGENGRPYNVGSPEGISIADLARTVAGCFEHETKIRILKEALPGIPPQRYVPSVQRAERELGLKVNISLKNAICKMRDFHEKPVFSEKKQDNPQ